MAPKGVNHGERFWMLCDLLDVMLPDYSRKVPIYGKEIDYPAVKEGEPYLITHLKFYISRKKIDITETRSGSSHLIAMVNANNRWQLPCTIISRMIEVQQEYNLSYTVVKQQAVPPTWIVCYINNIRPDKSVEGWKNFECSHTCISYAIQEKWNCIDPACLVWEAKNVNQSRGNQFCVNKCFHGCGKSICECNNLHDPPCH